MYIYHLDLDAIPILISDQTFVYRSDSPKKSGRELMMFS